MAFLIVHHQVEDYKKWKPLYDLHEPTRKQAGCKSEQLLRSSEDPNDLFIVFEWDSVENARRFSQSQDLKQVMEKAGVIGKPEIHYLDQIERKITGEVLERKAA